MADKMKLIAYLSGGYPTMDKSAEMAKLYVTGGCDAIEFSAPESPYGGRLYRGKDGGGQAAV